MAQPSLFSPYFDLAMQYRILLVIRSLHRDIELYKFTLVMQKRILTIFHDILSNKGEEGKTVFWKPIFV